MRESSIDRRAGREIASFCLLSESYYESLNTYTPGSSEYKRVLDSHLPLGWVVRHDKLWYHVSPPNGALPPQGFKIHLAATSLSAEALLETALPLLVARHASFKLVVDPFILDFVNSKNFPRGSSGKFLTIYPKDDEDCKALLESLYGATTGMRGPFILSDRLYRDSRVVFYRYGGFTPRHKLTIFGERMPTIVNASGKEEPDLRLPAFRLPEGITDPFYSPPDSAAFTDGGGILLKERYLVKSAITFSNSGGVYKAYDRRMDRPVIIKEARPFVNLSRQSGRDAVDILKKESQMLALLEDTGLVPHFIDFFDEWEHYFLVEEYVDGIPLSSYRSDERWALVLGPTGDPQRVAAFCAKLSTLSLNLIKTLQIFHSRGIVFGDLSPRNVIVDPNTLDLRIVDFESAGFSRTSDQECFTPFTPGFASANRRRGQGLSAQDDYYAAGCVVYSLMMPIVPVFFDLKPEAKKVFLDRISWDYQLPSNISQGIESLMEGSVDHAKELLESHSLPPTRGCAGPEEQAKAHQDIGHMIGRIREHIDFTAEYDRDDRLWPADYRVFTTNALSVSYGALGICLFLKQECGNLAPRQWQWIVKRAGQINNESIPPGLYLGASGIAWVLSELGLTEEAVRIISAAYDSPLLFTGPDVFYGCAGVGLVSLYLWARTRRQSFLDKATLIGDHLLKISLEDDAGCYWRNVDGRSYYGYAHGGSGISLFLLYLYRDTQDPRYLQYACRGMDFEISCAVTRNGSLAWGREQGDPITFPYWRFGSAGVGSALIRFYEILKKDNYRDLAARAARYGSTKYAVLPGQFYGLSGIGELLLDLYSVTGDRTYLDDAHQVARKILLYEISTNGGVAFPGEELLRISNDLGTGSAGVGLFLSRLLKHGRRFFYDWDAFAPAETRAITREGDPFSIARR
jgi:serine/threonine protein kinase